MNRTPAHPIHRCYYAEELVRARRASERRRQVASQRRAQIDPNPHQIDAVPVEEHVRSMDARPRPESSVQTGGPPTAAGSTGR